MESMMSARASTSAVTPASMAAIMTLSALAKWMRARHHQAARSFWRTALSEAVDPRLYRHADAASPTPRPRAQSRKAQRFQATPEFGTLATTADPLRFQP